MNQEAGGSGAQAWKDRRAQILGRNKAAPEGEETASDRADNRVADQRRANAGRDDAQLRAAHSARLAKKRARG